MQTDSRNHGEQHVHLHLVRRLMVISMRAAGADWKYKPVHQEKHAEAAYQGKSGVVQPEI